jgi:hypothetical protein
MTNPRSIRFEDRVLDRLNAYSTRHPGLSSSAAASRFVDEGLRMELHPGVIFRDGPFGRRALLVGGPDVWEVIRAVRSARKSEPGLVEKELLELVGENSGVTERMLRIAIDYRSDYPEEIDALIEYVDQRALDLASAQARTKDLLGA